MYFLTNNMAVIVVPMKITKLMKSWALLALFFGGMYGLEPISMVMYTIFIETSVKICKTTLGYSSTSERMSTISIANKTWNENNIIGKVEIIHKFKNNDHVYTMCSEWFNSSSFIESKIREGVFCDSTNCQETLQSQCPWRFSTFWNVGG